MGCSAESACGGTGGSSDRDLVGRGGDEVLGSAFVGELRGAVGEDGENFCFARWFVPFLGVGFGAYGVCT